MEELNPNVYLAIIAAFVALVTPLSTVWATSYARRSDRAEDRKDRAEVAAQVVQAAKKAEEAANLLVESNAEVAKAAAKSDERTNGQLKQIHTLVNNNLTTAVSTALDALKSARVSTKELIELKKSLGQSPTTESLASVAAMESRISELGQQLMDRKIAAETVEREQIANPVDQK